MNNHTFRPAEPNHNIATFGAGCFWGVEHYFYQINGVLSTKVGYGGGSTPSPNYKSICQGDTGHAELLHLLFDSDVIPYNILVEKFFDCHDPTQLNRQGPDVGDQYRSVIFTHDDAQHQIAQHIKQQLTEQHKYLHPIVTKIEPYRNCTTAEEYHQKYFMK